MAIPEKAITAALLFSFVNPLWAFETQDPVSWLERMSRSAQELDYEGTFVYRSGDQLQTLRIIHSSGPDQERERLIALSGPPREVIREGNRVACLLPGDASVFVNPDGERGTLTLNLPSQLQALQRYYQIGFDGGGRVAGRAARKVAIRPKDRFRYAHNYWIAGDSGLLLRAELLDDEDRVLEEVIFTSITLHEHIPPEILEPETAGGRPAWQELEQGDVQGVAGGRWRLEGAPPGFEKTVHRRRAAQQDAPSVEHMVFSDGLASVSVFIEPVDENSNPGQMHRGPLNARVKIVDDHRVTVVGEVPAVTVEHVASGVHPAREKSQ